MYSRIFLIMGRFTNGEEDPKGLLIASLVKVLIASLMKGLLIASLMKGLRACKCLHPFVG